MANAFDIAMRAIMTDPNMAISALYSAGGTGPQQSVRILMRAPDVQKNWNEVTITTETVVIEVLVADIAVPAQGDQFEIGDQTYRVQGTPERDSLRLIWQIELAPIE